MKLPIHRIPGTTPPKFEYYQTVTLPQGGAQIVKYIECAPTNMESALCALIEVTQQLAVENERLKSRK